MIRTLAASELDVVRGLRRALHEHHDGLPTPPGFTARPFEASWAAWRETVARTIGRRTGTVLVHYPDDRDGDGDGRNNSEPDGMAYLHLLEADVVTRPFLAPTGPHVELATLVVAGTARGTGLGTRLTDAGTAWAREHGAVAMHIAVRATNLDARRLYLRLGAEPVFETLVRPL